MQITKLEDAYVRLLTGNRLSVEQKMLFLSTHKAHLSGMGTEKQQQFQLRNITKIVWVSKEECFHVHYDSGIWFHYDKRHLWY